MEQNPSSFDVGLGRARVSELRANPRDVNAYRDIVSLFERNGGLLPEHIDSTAAELERFRVSTGSGTAEIYSPH